MRIGAGVGAGAGVVAVAVVAVAVVVVASVGGGRLREGKDAEAGGVAGGSQLGVWPVDSNWWCGQWTVSGGVTSG